MRTTLTKVNIIKLCSAFFCFALIVLSCVFLKGSPKYVILAALALFSLLGVLIPSLDAHKHEAVFKSSLVLLIGAGLFLAAYIIMEKTGALEKMTDVETVLKMIRSTKQLGVFVYIAFVIINVVILPLPAPVPAIIGTALYGPLFSFIYMSIGYVAGSIISFAMGRTFGKRLVIWMMGRDKTEKYADMLEKGKFLFVLMMIVPFFPDDVLCMVAGLTNMTYKFFVLVICTTRTVVLAFVCFFVDGSIIPFKGWGIPVWIAIFAATIIAFVIITILKRKSEKKDKL